ncbi:hypothetical protein PspLS_12048, partial [Pyricularia sp. CBS 133598]
SASTYSHSSALAARQLARQFLLDLASRKARDVMSLSSLVLILLFSCCWSLYTHHLTVDSHCPSLRSAVASRPGRQEILEHNPCRKSDALVLITKSDEYVPP